MCGTAPTNCLLLHDVDAESCRAEPIVPQSVRDLHQLPLLRSVGIRVDRLLQLRAVERRIRAPAAGRPTPRDRGKAGSVGERSDAAPRAHVPRSRRGWSGRVRDGQPLLRRPPPSTHPRPGKISAGTSAAAERSAAAQAATSVAATQTLQSATGGRRTDACSTGSVDRLFDRISTGFGDGAVRPALRLHIDGA